MPRDAWMHRLTSGAGLTGLVLGLLLSVLPLQSAIAADEQLVTITVQDADIRALTQWMSHQLNRSIILDPRVKGTVTVHAGEPMTRDEAYQVFLSVLQVHGYAAIESGSVIKVVPDVNAKQQSLPVVTRTSKMPGDAMVVRVIKVKNVSAVQLVALLRPLIPQVGHLAAYPSTNVLVISDRAANVSRIVSIVNEIDRAGSIDIELVPLKNADASQVVDVLDSMLPKTPGAQGGGRPQMSFGADGRSNSVLIGGDPLVRQQLRSLIRQLDAPLAREGNTSVTYLHYARAEDVVPILQNLTGSIQRDQEGGQSDSDRVSVEAAETTNAVVISAPPSIQRTLQAVIKKLDIRRAQVLVEAVIVEVNDTTLKKLGIEWGDNGGPAAGGTGLIAGSRHGMDIGTYSGEFNAFATPGAAALESGLSLGYLRNGSLRGLLRALNSDTSNNILSTPSIVTLDNEEAEILVGQNVPFITGTELRDGGDKFQTIERNDVGVTLKIRPHVNQGDAITLEVNQEVSSVTESAQVESDVVTNKRSIRTRVLIENDQILVLGGLISDVVSDQVNKVPWLGDIPVVGHLFKSTEVTVEKVNLMVFIHPVILRDQAHSNQVTEGRYNTLRGEQKQFNKRLPDFFDLDDGPLLPGFDEYRQQAVMPQTTYMPAPSYAPAPTYAPAPRPVAPSETYVPPVRSTQQPPAYVAPSRPMAPAPATTAPAPSPYFEPVPQADPAPIMRTPEPAPQPTRIQTQPEPAQVVAPAPVEPAPATDSGTSTWRWEGQSGGRGPSHHRVTSDDTSASTTSSRTQPTTAPAPAPVQAESKREPWQITDESMQGEPPTPGPDDDGLSVLKSWLDKTKSERAPGPIQRRTAPTSSTNTTSSEKTSSGSVSSFGDWLRNQGTERQPGPVSRRLPAGSAGGASEPAKESTQTSTTSSPSRRAPEPEPEEAPVEEDMGQETSESGIEWLPNPESQERHGPRYQR